MFDLTGEFHHQVDEKGRIRIPSRFKSALGVSPMIVTGREGCLYMYERDKAEEVIKTYFMDKEIDDEDYAKAVRLIASSVIFPTEDKQGRIQLSPNLIKHAGITKNIISLGTFDRVEIWSEESWLEYIGKDKANFDKCMITAKKKKLTKESQA